jgi:hypothetical protein
MSNMILVLQNRENHPSLSTHLRYRIPAMKYYQDQEEIYVRKHLLFLE